MSRILILEDEFDLRETLTMFLSAAGYAVEGTERVKDALNMLKDRHFDAALLDLMLPDGAGTDVLDSIRDDDQLADIPVIIMSAIPPVKPSQNERDVPFLQKPFPFAKLQAALEELGVWEDQQR